MEIELSTREELNMPDIKGILQKQRSFFNSGATKELSFRIKNLEKLLRAVSENENAIIDALKDDLNKPSFEAYATEIGIVLDEIKYTLKHLPAWVKNKRVRTPVMHFLSSSYIKPEPYGISLIMSPWNYPFQLAIAPLVGSISAGNCTMVKPSAYSPATSSVINKIIRENFDEAYIAVIEGGRDENKALLDEKFDYIFFTGSISVGKLVMEAASRNLTPVTLELGGKSPCIVDRKVNVDLAARRIVWGKFLNAGQTCVAPDYILVHKDVKSELLKQIKKYVREFYGDSPVNNPDFPKIINLKHFQRLKDLMQQGEIIAGGESDESTLVIEPTIVDEITWESPVMQEEIFGPVMPILEYEDLSQVINEVNSRPKPLALYFFSTDSENQKKIIESISFGGGCINDTIIHLATPYMPFSGVGESGMGAYHGKASFDTFSHKKSVLKKSNLFDIKLRYPPYKNNITKLKKILG